MIQTFFLLISVKVKEAVVENIAVLSYAVEEEQHTYLSPAVKLDSQVSNVLMCTALLELFGFIFSFVLFIEMNIC